VRGSSHERPIDSLPASAALRLLNSISFLTWTSSISDSAKLSEVSGLARSPTTTALACMPIYGHSRESSVSSCVWSHYRGRSRRHHSCRRRRRRRSDLDLVVVAVDIVVSRHAAIAAAITATAVRLRFRRPTAISASASANGAATAALRQCRGHRSPLVWCWSPQASACTSSRALLHSRKVHCTKPSRAHGASKRTHATSLVVFCSQCRLLMKA